MSEGLLEAIKNGIASAREQFAAAPEDFNGELSDHDLVAFIYPKVHRALKQKSSPSLAPSERRKAVERVAVAMLDQVNAISGFQSTDVMAYYPLAEAAIAAMHESTGQNDRDYLEWLPHVVVDRRSGRIIGHYETGAAARFAAKAMNESGTATVAAGAGETALQPNAGDASGRKEEGDAGATAQATSASVVSTSPAPAADRSDNSTAAFLVNLHRKNFTLEKALDFLRAHNDGVYKITASKHLDELVEWLLWYLQRRPERDFNTLTESDRELAARDMANAIEQTMIETGSKNYFLAEAALSALLERFEIRRRG